MLFPPHSVELQRNEVLRDLQENRIDLAAAAERLRAIDPLFAGSYVFLANVRTEEGAFDEAEALFWTALEHGPCSAAPYFGLSELRKRTDDPMAMELTALGMYGVALSGDVPDYFTERFQESMPEGNIDFRDPATYEVLGFAVEEELEKRDPPYEPHARLRPYHLLIDFRREAADEGVDEATLDDILGDAAACLPVFHSALREWARRPNALSPDALPLLVAMLGEIGGPDLLEDLFEVAKIDEWGLILHASWAVWRIGQRFPAETVAAMRRATPTADVAVRCEIAELLMLLPETPGTDKALMELLTGFDALAKQEEAGFLLVAVTEGLRRLGLKREARDVLKRYEERLAKKARRAVRNLLESGDGFVPNLENAMIPELDITGVVVERALMEDDEEDEGDEDDDEFDSPRPPAVRPGRNDPCWCGSGKKYKKCHLESDERAPEEDEAAEDTLVGKVFGDILDCSGDWHNLTDIGAAHRLFFDSEPAELDADEVAESGFAEWYVMSFRSPSSGRTLVEEYLRRRGPRLAEPERRLAESWRDLRFGLWEVERVDEEKGVELKNLLEGDTIFVHDVSSSQSMVLGDLDIARVHYLEDKWQFAGNGLGVPRPMLKAVMDLVEEGSRKAGQSPGAYFAANSHLWHRMLEKLYKESRRGLRIVNAEGNALEFCHALYELLDVEAAATALRNAKMFEETTSTEDTPGVLRFAWLESGEGARRSYGSIELGDGELKLECNSRERLAIGRQLLEKHAGKYLRHLEDTFTSVEEAMERMPAAKAGSSKGKLDPEVERDIILEFKAEHYGKWPDEPLPALGGQTPREAARSETGRRALDDLIRDLENREEHERKAGRPAHDFSTLRKELGVPRR